MLSKIALTCHGLKDVPVAQKVTTREEAVRVLMRIGRKPLFLRGLYNIGLLSYLSKPIYFSIPNYHNYIQNVWFIMIFTKCITLTHKQSRGTLDHVLANLLELKSDSPIQKSYYPSIFFCYCWIKVVCIM